MLHYRQRCKCIAVYCGRVISNECISLARVSSARPPMPSLKSYMAKTKWHFAGFHNVNEICLAEEGHVVQTGQGAGKVPSRVTRFNSCRIILRRLEPSPPYTGSFRCRGVYIYVL